MFRIARTFRGCAKIIVLKKNSPLPMASLWENSSLKKRGTLKIAQILPVSSQEKGLGDEFKHP
jgi:hypothetical protein